MIIRGYYEIQKLKFLSHRPSLALNNISVRGAERFEFRNYLFVIGVQVRIIQYKSQNCAINSTRVRFATVHPTSFFCSVIVTVDQDCCIDHVQLFMLLCFCCSPIHDRARGVRPYTDRARLRAIDCAANVLSVHSLDILGGVQIQFQTFLSYYF